ncbi:MAG: protein TolR [Alcanivoracaceae bacterium]|nr:protein TolR [Alcanivoracaceae bacterium]
MNSLKVRAPRKLVAEINVVPYIDVMLVLLVVFMITAPMMTQGIKVELPQTDSTPITSDNQEPVVVTIKKDGSYYINVGGDTKQSSSLETVKGHALRIKKHKPDTLFLVEGDAAVDYGKVIALMSALQGAGIEKLGLVTEPPEK